MVLWHDCEIDHYRNQGRPAQKAFAAVAPIFGMMDRINDEKAREAIRRLERRALFPLQRFETDDVQFDEGYVDLRLLWSVKQDLLIPNRIATISEKTLQALYNHLFRFFTRRRLANLIKCPQCDAEIDSAELLISARGQD